MSEKTLLLSAWYLPLRVLRWQDAVRLIYLGSVDVLAEYSVEIRSPSTTWRMPAVVRQRRSRVFKAAVRFSRANVYARDSYCCQYCGRRFAWEALTYDHVVPRSRGGRTHFANIVTACKPCNARKGNLACDEAGMFPLNAPVRPRALPVSARPFERSSVPPEWAPFLAAPA